LGSLDRLIPQPLDDRPRLAKPFGVGWSQLHPLRVPPIELRFDERDDVDAVDGEASHLAVDGEALHVAPDGNVLESGLPDLHPAEVDPVEARAGEQHLFEGRARQVDPLETSTGEITLEERLGHGAKRKSVLPGSARPSPFSRGCRSHNAAGGVYA